MNIDEIRSQFPSLRRRIDGKQVVYLDGPGGSQVPSSVTTAMSDYLLSSHANLGPNFATGQETIALVERVRTKASRFFSCEPSAVSFGQNSTSLFFALSRAIARNWKPGDEVVVTEMDHEANISPWLEAAKDKGATVRVVPYNKTTDTVAASDFEPYINSSTKLVAFTLSSNLTGSMVDPRPITELAHQYGALVVADATHYAAHNRINVRAIGCDFLVCSGYKFFAPHIGLMYANPEIELEPYKIDPAPSEAPYRWETGTQNFPAIAGLGATFDYLVSLGGPDNIEFDAAYSKIRDLETQLSSYFLERLANRPELSLHGIDDTHGRESTFALSSNQKSPAELSVELNDQAVFVWNGHMYAVRLVEALGLERDSGVLRVGLMHYNTKAEIDRFFEAI